MNDTNKIQSTTGEIKPDKVKALAENIIAECKQQGFTIKEFFDLISELELKRLVREYELQRELI